jgi:organic radical activating enzyme
MIPVYECFYSVQGEGRRAGNPTIFLRFGGCNFQCPGFRVPYKDPKTGENKLGCDSYYSVDRGFKDNWALMDYHDMIKLIQSLINHNHYTKVDICITGGEPTMYWDNHDFQRTIQYFASRGHHITIETNASLDVKFEYDYQRDIAFSMSVKLAVSGEKESRRVNIDNITKIVTETKESYLKFVVEKESDVEEISSILEKVAPLTDVYLMPLGDTIESLNKTRKFVMETCVQKGFKYSDRLHILAWDNKEGV